VKNLSSNKEKLHIRSKQGCPSCNSSKGEILSKLNVKYIKKKGIRMIRLSYKDNINEKMIKDILW
jgi:thioredoxin-related protein